MGDHDCLSALESDTSQVNEQTGIFEHSDAHKSDIGCIYRHHHTAELSETRLEPARTAKSKVGGKSKIPTTRPLRCTRGGYFLKREKIGLFKGFLRQIMINSDFYRTAINNNNRANLLITHMQTGKVSDG